CRGCRRFRRSTRPSWRRGGATCAGHSNRTSWTQNFLEDPDMAVNPTTRSGKGSPLLPSEGDANWTALATAINALESKLGVVLNPDGTLKAGAVGTTAAVADMILTL